MYTSGIFYSTIWHFIYIVTFIQKLIQYTFQFLHIPHHRAQRWEKKEAFVSYTNWFFQSIYKSDITEDDLKHFLSPHILSKKKGPKKKKKIFPNFHFSTLPQLETQFPGRTWKME